MWSTTGKPEREERRAEPLAWARVPTQKLLWYFFVEHFEEKPQGRMNNGTE
jgi:hypothetical protein